MKDLFYRFIEAGGEILTEPNSDTSPGELLALLLDPEQNKIGIIGPLE